MSGFWLRGVHVSGLSMFDRESDTDSDTLETRLKGVVNAITVISYRWYGRLRSRLGAAGPHGPSCTLRGQENVGKI